jgi:hypothetical protein
MWGTATKIFLRVRYETTEPRGPGEVLCLKGGFDGKLEGVDDVAKSLEVVARWHGLSWQPGWAALRS